MLKGDKKLELRDGKLRNKENDSEQPQVEQVGQPQVEQVGQPQVEQVGQPKVNLNLQSDFNMEQKIKEELETIPNVAAQLQQDIPLPQEFQQSQQPQQQPQQQEQVTNVLLTLMDGSQLNVQVTLKGYNEFINNLQQVMQTGEVIEIGEKVISGRNILYYE